MTITKIIQFIVFLAICKNITARVRRNTEGSAISIQEAPWFVSIRHKWKHVCIGTLITPEHVLTAAHCFEISNSRFRHNVTVVSGTDQKNFGGLCHEVDKIHTYSPVMMGFQELQQPDIAIIYLSGAVNYDTTQYKINLPNTPPNYRTGAVFIGFAYQSAALHQFEAIIASPDNCYHPENKVRGLQVHRTLCGLHDVLHGRGEDNGGAPLIQDGKIIGIASVQSAALGYDLYTNVYVYGKSIIKDTGMIEM